MTRNEPHNMATMQEEILSLRRANKRINVERIRLDMKLHQIEDEHAAEIILAVKMSVDLAAEGHPIETIIRRIVDSLEKKRAA